MLAKNGTASIYASDTAGVCSALYELGGMTVIHDASGCNSTYSTHDEPRWYEKDSMIYITGLTEQDMIMGDESKLVDIVSNAAKRLSPLFIALCMSPMPAMIGTDLESCAKEIERNTGITTFAIMTDGAKNYLYGASEAFFKIASLFTSKHTEKKCALNILGLTPLDVGDSKSVEKIIAEAEKHGFSQTLPFAMDMKGSGPEKLSSSSRSLAVSSSGIKTAEYLYEKYAIPYICAYPTGDFSSKVFSCLKGDCSKTQAAALFPEGAGKQAAVIGEPVYSLSMKARLKLEIGIEATAVTALKIPSYMPVMPDMVIETETELKNALNDFDTVIADPMFKPLADKAAKFISVPHVAYSGRTYLKHYHDDNVGSFIKDYKKTVLGEIKC